MPRIVIHRDSTRRGEVEFDTQAVTLGSGPECQVRLDDASVDPAAAIVSPSGGTWTIMPTGATEVAVGGRPIDAVTELRPPTEIRIGPFQLLYQDAPKPPAAPSVAATAPAADRAKTVIVRRPAGLAPETPQSPALPPTAQAPPPPRPAPPPPPQPAPPPPPPAPAPAGGGRAQTVVVRPGAMQTPTQSPPAAGGQAPAAAPSQAGGAYPVNYLLAIAGPQRMQKWAVDRETYIIGRDPAQAQLVIDATADGEPDTSISRAHARIRLSEGRMWIADTSHAGTFVNGKRLVANEELELWPNDEIEIHSAIKSTVLRVTDEKNFNFAPPEKSQVRVDPSSRQRIYYAVVGIIVLVIILWFVLT